MRHFRVELHAVPALVLVVHHRDRNAVGGAGNDEARRRLGDMVAMTHPHIEPMAVVVVAQAVEQAALGDDVDFGVTELARVGRLGRAAELRGQSLHAVADAEDAAGPHRKPAVAPSAHPATWSIPGHPRE